MDTLHLYLDRMREEQLAQRNQIADLREAQVESLALLRAIVRRLQERPKSDSTPSKSKPSVLPALGTATWLQYAAIGLLSTYLWQGGDALTALEKLMAVGRVFGAP